MKNFKDACQNDWMIVTYVSVVIVSLLTLGLNVAHYPLVS